MSSAFNGVGPVRISAYGSKTLIECWDTENNNHYYRFGNLGLNLAQYRAAGPEVKVTVIPRAVWTIVVTGTGEVLYEWTILDAPEPEPEPEPKAGPPELAGPPPCDPVLRAILWSRVN